MSYLCLATCYQTFLVLSIYQLSIILYILFFYHKFFQFFSIRSWLSINQLWVIHALLIPLIYSSPIYQLFFIFILSTHHLATSYFLYSVFYNYLFQIVNHCHIINLESILVLYSSIHEKTQAIIHFKSQIKTSIHLARKFLQ